MLPACNRALGANVHAPDVCLTPPVPGAPIAYVNTAYNMTSVAFVPHVILVGAPAHNIGTFMPVSIGDEKGVLHWTILGPSWYVQGSPVVMVAKLPGTHLTNRSIGNKGNAPQGMCAIPSCPTVLYTFAGEDESAHARDVALTSSASDAVTSWLGDESIGVVVIKLFASSVPHLLRSALSSLMAQGATGFAIDLRGNRGGDLDAAVRAASELLPRGTPIVRLVDVDGDEEVRSSRNDQPNRLPVLLYVDRETASAAEVFAAALQDARRAIVVGQTTYGKGTACAYALDQGYRMTHRVCRPSGADIHGVGVEPDMVIDAQ